MNTKSLIDDVLIVCGISVSLLDIQQTLSIVLLVFNVLWIIWKFIYRVYTHIKNNQIDEIENDIKDAKDEIEKFTNDSKKEK